MILERLERDSQGPGIELKSFLVWFAFSEGTLVQFYEPKVQPRHPALTS